MVLLIEMGILLATLSGIVWFIFKLGLLSYPNVALPGVGTLPVIIGTVMLTGDLRGILWWFVCFAVYAVVYYPFFKVFERNVIAKEETAVSE